MSWPRYAWYFWPYLLKYTGNHQNVLFSLLLLLFYFFGSGGWFSQWSSMKLTCHTCLEGHCWFGEAVGDHKGNCNWGLWEGHISISLSFCVNGWLHPCNSAYLLLGFKFGIIQGLSIFHFDIFQVSFEERKEQLFEMVWL